MGTTRRTQLAILFLLFAGGGMAVAMNGQDARQAAPAANQPPNGSGTVSASPAPATATPAPAASPTSSAAPNGGPGAGSSGSGTGTVEPAARPTASPAPGGGKQPDVFYIFGGVADLVPGAPTSMALTVRNPNSFPIHLLTLTTTVGNPGVANCPAAGLSVAEYRYTSGAGIIVKGGATVQVPVRVELLDSLTMDQSGCPSATFPLTFGGTAETGR